MRNIQEGLRSETFLHIFLLLFVLASNLSLFVSFVSNKNILLHNFSLQTYCSFRFRIACSVWEQLILLLNKISFLCFFRIFCWHIPRLAFLGKDYRRIVFLAKLPTYRCSSHVVSFYRNAITNNLTFCSFQNNRSYSCIWPKGAALKKSEVREETIFYQLKLNNTNIAGAEYIGATESEIILENKIMIYRGSQEWVQKISEPPSLTAILAYLATKRIQCSRSKSFGQQAERLNGSKRIQNMKTLFLLTSKHLE